MLPHSRSWNAAGGVGRKRLLFTLVGVLALAAALAWPAQRRQSPPADSFRNFRAGPSLLQLIERAETIVAGEVLELESAWTESRSTIYTTVTLRVDRRLKGGGAEVVRFRIPGGTVGDQAMIVTHSPRFSVGERTLVFLGPPRGLLPRIVGGQAGKRHIRVEENGSETVFPSFALEDSEGGTSKRLHTLDELTAALSRLAASALR